ncbi:TonB-dependent receptor [Bacteroidales bacterium OttesenSCG-928-M11]|nr:TonB-dependent receptor [Bacteroidales bacterium OttesenSCG-928-M11]
MKKVFLYTILCLLPYCNNLRAEDYLIENDSLNSLRLQTVDIIATRATEKTPIAYSNINKQEIKSYNLGMDIPYLLSLSPSVVSTSDAGANIGYTKFRIRGTDSNRINITSNGIPMNEAESHDVFWVNIPDFASSLQDIQIQRGVGTSTNGAGAFGASVNMKTEAISNESYGEFNAGYGSFNTQKVTFKAGTGLINGRWAFDTRLSSITSDGYIDRAEVDLKSYFLQGAYYGDNTLVKFITFSGKEKTYHAWDGVLSDSLKAGNRTYNHLGYMGDDENGKPIYYKNQTDNYKQTHYQLHLLQSFSSRLSLNAALHYTRGEGYYEEYKANRTLKEYGLLPYYIDGEEVEKSDLVRQKHLDNYFGGAIFSLNYKADKLNASLGGGGNYYDGGHFGRVIWVKHLENNPNFRPDHEYYDSKGKKLDMNLYLKANYQLTDALSLYGDIQYRHIDYKIKGQNDTWDRINGEMQRLNIHENFDFFNPKAGLFYQMSKKSAVYASFAMAHREPNRNNYTDADANNFPSSERLMDYELGYKYQTNRLSIGVNLYYMQYKDQLVLTGKVNEIGEGLTSNVPDSYRTGVEFMAGVEILPCLKWNGNLTFSRNKIKDYTEYIPVDDGYSPHQEIYHGTTTISYSPDLIANSFFLFHHKNFSAGFHSNYVSKQYLDNTERKDRSISSYFVNNLRLGYNFKVKGLKEFGVNVLIENLFDTKYETNGYVWEALYTGNDGNLISYSEKYYFPQAGINFLANITAKF